MTTTPPTAPSPLDTVVAAIRALDDPERPYSIVATPTPSGAEVEVRWRIEEVRWHTLFVRGSVVYHWKMLVQLDATKAQYAFTEYQAETRHQVGVWPPRAKWEWKKSRGRTAGQVRVHGTFSSFGEVREALREGVQGADGGALTVLRPADAKVPVFTTLREHGWRPRRDSRWARLFER